MSQSYDSLLLGLLQAANAGAFGFNQKRPSEAQCFAGNYRTGRWQWGGLTIAIEQPEGSIREKTAKDGSGKVWRNVMGGHYGYIAGTKGNDGDAVDCFIGQDVLSTRVFVINQGFGSKFDEHKVMLCYDSAEKARSAYMRSYSPNWQGLQSMHECSLKQLHWWLFNCDTKKSFNPAHLPFEGAQAMQQRTYWDSEALPISTTLDAVMQAMRDSDTDDGLLLDSVTEADILGDPDNQSVLTLDALVTEFVRLDRRMLAMQRVMNRVGGDLKIAATQVTKPFKQRGIVNVAVIFELTDGQTISVYFHNPDAKTTKVAPNDEIISWKWLLNKKDVTIWVAPERGKDLQVQEVGRRLMKVAGKNSEAFARANEKRTQRLAEVQDLNSEIAQLEEQLAQLLAQIETVKAQIELAEEAKAKADKEAAALAQQQAATPKPVLDESLQKWLNRIADVQGKLQEKGVSFPDANTFMADVNAGNRQGYSVVELQAKLAENEANLAGVQQGTIKSREMVGRGAKKADAINWLQKNINELNTAINSGGYLYSLNLVNHLSALETILRTGEDDGYTTQEQRDTQKEQEEARRKEWQEQQEKTDADLDAEYEKTKGYTDGSLDGMKRPIDFSFTLNKDLKQRAVDLMNAPMDKRLGLLRDAVNGGFAKAQDKQFRDTVDANTALKRGVPFGYFSMEPRVGYTLVKLVIDADAKGAKKQDDIEIDTYQKLVTFTRVLITNVGEENLYFETEDGTPYYTKLLEPHDYTVNEWVSLAEGVQEKALEEKLMAFAEKIANSLASMGWSTDNDSVSYVASNPYEKNSSVIIGMDDYPQESLDIYFDDGVGKFTANLGDDPRSMAKKIDDLAYRFSLGAEDENQETVQDEDSEFFEKRFEFVRANEFLEKAAQQTGCEIVWGDFNNSLTTGGLFDSATHYGVSAQIGKDGRVVCRAEISEMGEVTLYTGATGANVAADKLTDAQAIVIALEQLVAAMPADAPALPQATETTVEPEPAPQGKPPADNDLTRLWALKGLVPKGAISSTDPQAIEKLTAKLNYLLANSAMMRKANKFVRAKNKDALREMGFNDKLIEGLFTPDFAGREGFPDYELTNNNSEARRTKKRIEQLQAQQEQEQEQPQELQQPTRTGTEQEQAAADAALAIAQGVVSELGGTFEATGFSMDGTLGAWSYGKATLNGVEITLAGSGGGVISINGKPHDLNGQVMTEPYQVRDVLLSLSPTPEPTPEPTQNPDIAVLQGLIDGTADRLNVDYDAIGAMAENYADNPEMIALIEQAIEATTAAQLAA